MATKNTSFSLPKEHFLPQNKEEAELMDFIENTDFPLQSDTRDIHNIQQAFKNTLPNPLIYPPKTAEEEMAYILESEAMGGEMSLEESYRLTMEYIDSFN